MTFDRFTFLAGSLLSIVGVVAALLLLARGKAPHHRPGATMAWFISMIFIPWLAIPLYLIFGGRKIRRYARKKTNLKFRQSVHRPDLTKLNLPTRAVMLLQGSEPATTGNRVGVLDNPLANYQRLMSEIANAKESIYITTFILSCDDVGKAVVDALARRAAEGVKVRLIIDALGSRNAKGAFTDPIREAGGHVGIFMPIRFLRRSGSTNLRNHRKIFLFDRKTAIVGGLNIGKDYMSPTPDEDCWRDYAITIEGPAVASIIEIFAADWEFATEEDISSEIPDDLAELSDTDDHVIIQTVPSGPDQPGDSFYDALLAAMFQAQERIWIVTPYFLPDEMILRTLTTMARLGRDVRLVVPRRSDHRVVDVARRYFLRELTRAGGKVYLYGSGMVHSKLLLIDDETSSVGSANMDMRSFYLNYEIAMFVYSRRLAIKLEAHIGDLIKKSDLHERRPARKLDVVGETVENICGLISPLL